MFKKEFLLTWCHDFVFPVKILLVDDEHVRIRRSGRSCTNTGCLPERRQFQDSDRVVDFKHLPALETLPEVLPSQDEALARLGDVGREVESNLISGGLVVKSV